MNIPDYPPEFWAVKASYTNVPILVDGPVAEWAEELVGPYGYSWMQIHEWRWVNGEVPFAQFVCRRTDGGRDWLTIAYAKAPPIVLDKAPTTRLL